MMWRYFIPLLTTAGLTVVTSGCASTQQNELQAAMVKELSNQQKMEIESIISGWFGGTKVTLADDVFSRSSVITIERREHLDSQRLPVEGRHSNPAYTFTLYKQGEQCLIQYEGTDKQAVLNDVACIAVQ